MTREKNISQKPYKIYYPPVYTVGIFIPNVYYILCIYLCIYNILHTHIHYIYELYENGKLTAMSRARDFIIRKLKVYYIRSKWRVTRRTRNVVR